MLNLTHVTKRYGRFEACSDVSFAVEDGQIAVLLGPNGAGKSTLIKCISGLLRFQGHIEICGADNKSLEAKRALGYVPEMPAIYDMLTVGEHLEFIRRAYRLSDGKEYEEELQERFELPDKRNKLGKERSKGMQQKVSICCALLPRPKVVIFDEPMVGLDHHAIRQLKDTFHKLRQEGCSVLISTHMIDSVEDYWDVCHIMMRGQVAATRRSGETAEQSLEELFFSITEGTEEGKA